MSVSGWAPDLVARVGHDIIDTSEMSGSDVYVMFKLEYAQTLQQHTRAWSWLARRLLNGTAAMLSILQRT